MSNASTGSSKWDFIANSDNQILLADAIKQAATDFDSKKTEMFGKISDMGNYWKGADYDAFKESTNNYDPAICAYRDTIQAFGTHFENVSQLTETLVTDLTDIIEHMTGV